MNWQQKKIYFLLWIMILVSMTGCQISYYLHSGYHQSRILHQRVPVENVMQDPSTPPEIRRKLLLIEDVRTFAKNVLKLNLTSQYRSYVHLNRDHVSYIVQAAQAWRLEPYLWNFPIVGPLPYKGYFDRSMAEKEARTFDPKQYDTYVRGVTAYSTLGWFNDPILSTMMRYSDFELTELIIHESVHATLFIRKAADFNERLATFLGHKGAELYYLDREGENSEKILLAKKEEADQKLFSQFISEELHQLKSWYESENRTLEQKQARLKSIQNRFKENVQPQLKSHSYQNFMKVPLNNAYLLSLKTYLYDLSDFEKLFAIEELDFARFLKRLSQLKNSKNPEATLKDWIRPQSL